MLIPHFHHGDHHHHHGFLPPPTHRIHRVLHYQVEENVVGDHHVLMRAATKILIAAKMRTIVLRIVGESGVLRAEVMEKVTLFCGSLTHHPTGHPTLVQHQNHILHWFQLAWSLPCLVLELLSLLHVWICAATKMQRHSTKTAPF